ncbi:MAG: vWA domain-containing protein [Myxococcota bacterium]
MREFLLLSTALLPTAALAVPCSELPVLFVVQDKSGSMDKAPDGSTASASNPSKWSTAQQVVPSLASQFSNRFRFGAAMYPGATTTFNCTTGSVVAPVSNSPSGVQSAYANAVAGGGTPTAATLQQVKSYLLGLGLTTPAYVLLITDGLPNCNLALNPNTCTATTPGCANNACGLGAKDCLDDSASVQAAAQLFAAGIKVFVVGFDANLTAGNNKAVLDAIASAGGTGSAYVATNQAQLSATLNTIALNTATCCRDVCTAGAAQCLGTGQRQVCQLDASIGCTTWVTQSCPSMSTCQGGQCTSCTNQCAAGARRCTGDVAEQCAVGAGGCTQWTPAETCGYGELCTGGQCSSCQACNLGASRCTAGGGVETCEWDVLSGCTTWRAGTCASGSVCQNGSCATCNGACTAGATRCSGNTVQTCVADAAGCTSWQSSQTCTNFCSGGACGTCGTSCTAGATRCNGRGVETCIVDQNNCPAWGPIQQCQPNAYCNGGSCTACGASCTQGAKRCGANGATETCQLDANGCTGWVTTGACDVAGGERCDNGVCIPPCQDACAEGAAQCASGRPQTCERGPTGCTMWRDEPVCGADEWCVAGACRPRCTADEFEHCPAGLECTGTTEGRVCLPPDGSDAGAADAGTPGPTPDAGTTQPGPTTVGVDDPPANGPGGVHTMGCSCNAALDAAAPFLGLAVLALRRRRARR